MEIAASRVESIGQSIMHGLMTLLTLSFLYPIVLTFMVSISSERSVTLYGYQLIPKEFSLEAYRIVFATPFVIRAYGVTILTTLVGTALSIIICGAAGYAISLQRVKYRNLISMFFYIPMIFNAGLVPWYLVCTQVLHLRNSFAALVVPALVSSFNLFLMRNYFRTIPGSITESADIDGANPLKTFFSIIIPLSTPIIATATLFISLGYWNSWTEALWFIDNPNLVPLQYMLFKIRSQMEIIQMSGSIGNVQVPSQTFQVAVLFVTIGPIILVYPFVQKYFVKGIMVGAVKG
ncbi:MAG: carbohydrate ABC transporter permease [Treponema sp.]|jgi:ABC-type glycerol-3-phosphate transport system permease component|nr:carbohydrate ABC transporter permease [Treponema sp.]